MPITFALKGSVCHSLSPTTLQTLNPGYLICHNGLTQGIHPTLPPHLSHIPVIDCEHRLILPGLCDIHMHAPQYAFRALGMDLELLDWLNTRTFPEEAKYLDPDYARKAYDLLLKDLLPSPTTRLCVYATVHVPATLMLMEMLEQSGLVTFVGKVNMNRNTPEYLRETSAQTSAQTTRRWLAQTTHFSNTKPILTPRFIPSCDDELLRMLAQIRTEHNLPVQSHLSENRKETDWVRELCPFASGYADAYKQFGLLGGPGGSIMAHCVWLNKQEMELLAKEGVFVAHCPESNMNLASGIAPVRKFLNAGVQVGLGSDMAAGTSLSIFQAMAEAIRASKLHWRLVDNQDKPLSVAEAFWLGTAGGGEFFGKVGRFEAGYEFDAVVIDDSSLRGPFAMTVEERLARLVYLPEGGRVTGKFVKGKCVWGAKELGVV